jgi:hypothetical protein
MQGLGGRRADGRALLLDALKEQPGRQLMAT